MKVYTKWPGLIPAIRRAGHEPVLVKDPDPSPCPTCKAEYGHHPLCAPAGALEGLDKLLEAVDRTQKP